MDRRTAIYFISKTVFLLQYIVRNNLELANRKLSPVQAHYKNMNTSVKHGKYGGIIIC